MVTLILALLLPPPPLPLLQTRVVRALVSLRDPSKAEVAALASVSAAMLVILVGYPQAWLLEAKSYKKIQNDRAG